MLKHFKNCQQITAWVSQSYDEPLPFSQNMAVKLHMMICPKCRDFDKNNQLIKHMIQKHKMRDK